MEGKSDQNRTMPTALVRLQSKHLMAMIMMMFLSGIICCTLKSAEPLILNCVSLYILYMYIKNIYDFMHGNIEEHIYVCSSVSAKYTSAAGRVGSAMNRVTANTFEVIFTDGENPPHYFSYIATGKMTKFQVGAMFAVYNTKQAPNSLLAYQML